MLCRNDRSIWEIRVVRLSLGELPVCSLCHPLPRVGQLAEAVRNTYTLRCRGPAKASLHQLPGVGLIGKANRKC